MAKPKRDIVLRIDPEDAIVFRGNFAKEVTVSYLTLFNPSPEAVAYKVKTTAPRRYCVRPNSGKIDPNTEQKVKILLQPNTNNDDLSKHKFLVQTLELTPETLEANVEDLFKSKNPNLESSSKKLLCKFIDQDEPEAEGGPEPEGEGESLQQVGAGGPGASPNGDSFGDREPSVSPVQVQEPSPVLEQARAPKREVQFESSSPAKATLVQETQSYNSSDNKENEPTIQQAAPARSPAADKPIARQTIEAVPKEPTIINPSIAKAAAPSKVTQPVTVKKEAKKVENTSKYTTVSHDELKGLKDTIKSLESQLKQASSGMNVSVSEAGGESGLFWKAILIVGLMMFIMGWMLSSMLCKC